MKAVILAAGKGKRMRGLCAATPKPMLPIANRPILSASCARLRTMGVDEVALVVGFEGHKLQDLVGDGSQFGMRITYVWQKEQLGTGHATLLCEDFVGGDTFVLIFGDILTRSDNYPAMVKRFREGDCDGLLTVFPVEDPSNGAAVDVRDGYVSGIVEKPPPGTILNAYNNAGIFIWPPEIFDMIRNLEKSPRGEYEFTDGIIHFMNRGRRIAAFELLGYWENITDPEACIRMNQNLLMEELPPESPLIGSGAQIADSAEVVNCEVAPGVVVGEGCRVEDSRLGAGCRIGGNVWMKQAEVGAGATVGEGCRIFPNAVLGADRPVLVRRRWSVARRRKHPRPQRVRWSELHGRSGGLHCLVHPPRPVVRWQRSVARSRDARLRCRRCRRPPDHWHARQGG